jgi:foldase protein PrsA
MNQDQPQRRAQPDTPDTDEGWKEPGDGPAVETVVLAEYQDDETVDLADGEEVEAEQFEPTSRPVVTINRSLFLAMVAVGVLAILALGATTAWLALDRGGDEDPVVATVNGEQIRRSEYDKAVAQNNGEEVLDGLVIERLIAGEARKRNITVDEGEATRLLDEQRQQFGNEAAFQAALAQAGLTEADFNRQLRLGVMLRQMVADQSQVSDQEVNDMYQANAERYAGMSETEAKEQIRSGVKQQRENAAARDLLDQLRANAEIETRLPGKS